MPYKDSKKAKAYAKEWAYKSWRKKGANGQRRDYILRLRYGITEKQWNALFDKQGRKCGICQSSSPQSKVGWHTDHDHITRKVRGILCEHCNRGLGMYRDDIMTLQRAAAYLGLHNGVLTANSIEKTGAIEPFFPKSTRSGMTFGASCAGYDLTIDQNLVLKPKEFKLGSAAEFFNIPLDCVVLVCDKSSHARRGLSLFNTVAEPGWRGYLTLELFNASSKIIRLKKGDPIAQALFLSLDKPTEFPYTGKYQDQGRGPREAK